MLNPESALKNKLLLQIQTDHLILARRQDIIIVKKIKN